MVMEELDNIKNQVEFFLTLSEAGKEPLEDCGCSWR